MKARETDKDRQRFDLRKRNFDIFMTAVERALGSQRGAVAALSRSLGYFRADTDQANTGFISSLRNGSRRFTAELARKIEVAVDYPPLWFEQDHGRFPKNVPVPKLERTVPDSRTAARPNARTKAPAERTVAPATSTDDAFRAALRAILAAEDELGVTVPREKYPVLVEEIAANGVPPDMDRVKRLVKMVT